MVRDQVRKEAPVRNTKGTSGRRGFRRLGFSDNEGGDGGRREVGIWVSGRRGRVWEATIGLRREVVREVEED